VALTTLENYDPLLNHKMELIENEEDVFKMLEHVDKEAEEVENGAKVEEDDKGNVSIKMFDDDSSMRAATTTTTTWTSSRTAAMMTFRWPSACGDQLPDPDTSHPARPAKTNPNRSPGGDPRRLSHHRPTRST